MSEVRQRRKAVEIAELVLEKTNRSRWAGLGDVIKSEVDLALAYLSADQKEEAFRLAKLVVEKMKIVNDHDCLFAAKVRLGGIFSGIGKHSECINMLEGAVGGHNQMGHDNKRRPLEAQIQLAKAYIGVGQPNKAVELLESVVQDQASGQDLPQVDLVTSQLALGTAYESNEQLDDAIRLYSDFLPTLEGKSDLAGQRSYLGIKIHLATTYAMKGRWEDAIKLGQELEATWKVLTKRQGILDEESEDLLDSQYLLALVYLESGRSPEEGRRLVNHVAKARSRILGKRHSLTVSTQLLLAKYEEKYRN